MCSFIIVGYIGCVFITLMQASLMAVSSCWRTCRNWPSETPSLSKVASNKLLILLQYENIQGLVYILVSQKISSPPLKFSPIFKDIFAVI